jgi:ferredoxin-NADP reductase
VLFRSRDHEDAVLAHELEALAHRCGASLHLVTGGPTSNGASGRLLGARHLADLVPGIKDRDVFVCGPPGLTDAVLGSLRELGVPTHQCHTERFAFAA